MHDVGQQRGRTIFNRTSSNGIELWTGFPDCQAAHDALLGLLTGPFISPIDELGTRRQGNLGEFISLHVARNAPVLHNYAFAQNALQPLQNVSSSGLDLAYIQFGSTANEDLLYIQEVKTTGQSDLAYGNNLVSDHQKLFGEDAALTYNTRIQYLAAKLRFEQKAPDLADRVLNLAATEPKSCTQVRLIPTLVHERNGTTPIIKLTAVKSAITALGWAADNVEPWSIAMAGLTDRLVRLARGLS